VNQAIAQAVELLKRRGELQNEVQMRNDGTLFWTLLSSECSRWMEGVIVDIALVASRSRSTSSETELRTLFAAIPDPLFVTAEGQVIEAVEIEPISYINHRGADW